jgi:hypothetical protein
MGAGTQMLLLLVVLALPVHAGSEHDARQAGESLVPPLPYDSVFDAYRPYHHQPVAPWGASNDRVGEIGGWRTYARETAEQDDPGTVPPAGLAAPEGEPHHGGAP